MQATDSSHNNNDGTELKTTSHKEPHVLPHPVSTKTYKLSSWDSSHTQFTITMEAMFAIRLQQPRLVIVGYYLPIKVTNMRVMFHSIRHHRSVVATCVSSWDTSGRIFV
mmetsp:Transcript_18270/g.45279  ORF Transcript_18270/g.45279 Transcript_18270/m.45279 type:complete len:109 (+) Transcript_18270:556-882(+)